MHFSLFTTSILAFVLHVHALPSASSYYPTIRDGAAIGYDYTQEGCTAASTKDASGNVWYYVGTAPINDGTSDFMVPLLRRDDTGEFILFFPGSQNFSNYRQDLMIALVDYPFCSGCQVHQGFYQGWTSSRDAVAKLVKDNMVGSYASYNLVVAGGSLGGALGALAFAEFKANSSLSLASKTVRGYSLGQPRTGNFLFAKWFDGLTGASATNVGTWIRVTHGYDAIVRSPPVSKYGINQTPNTVYQHHGTEIWEVDNPSNGNHPSAATTYICYNRSDQSESTDCAESDANPGNPGDHLTYAGYDGPIPWETVACGAM